MKFRFNSKRATKRLLSYITICLDKGITLQRISDGIRAIVNSYTELNRDEKYYIYKTYYDISRKARSRKESWQDVIAQSGTFDSAITSCRKAEAASHLRIKRALTRSYLNDSETIFFLCSSHIKPAKDHAEYQGKIYVDMYWRGKVSGSEYYKVQSYIKNHNTLTVQYITGGPVWLTTRPYCKHYLIPIDTPTVLNNSVRKIVEDNGYQYSVEFTPEEYYKFRSKIYNILNEYVPSEKFEQQARKSERMRG